MANPGDTTTTLDGADLAKRLDPVDAARRGRVFEVALDADGSERLAELTEGRPAEVSGELRFGSDELGRILIEGELDAALTLRCERCLEPVDIRLQVPVALQLEGHGPVEPLEGYELLERDAGRDLIPRRLVEDEVLLSVPLAPRHEDIADCAPEVRELLSGEADGADPEERSEAEPSPFAVLESLKKER